MQHCGLQEHQLGQDEHEAADYKLLLVHGVYQWIFYPLWFESSACRNFLHFQKHMIDASRIFLSILVFAGWHHFVASRA